MDQPESLEQEVLLGQVAQLLRCPICDELLKAAVVFHDCASCPAFCSACIRRHFQFDQRCPVCLKERGLSSLRPVFVLQQMSEIFRPLGEEQFDELTTADPKSKRIKMDEKALSPLSTPRQQCDSCGMFFSSRLSFSHASECVAVHPNEAAAAVAARANQNVAGVADQTIQVGERLAARSYKHMSVQQLRDLCKELSLSDKGDKVSTPTLSLSLSLLPPVCFSLSVSGSLNQGEHAPIALLHSFSCHIYHFTCAVFCFSLFPSPSSL